MPTWEEALRLLAEEIRDSLEHVDEAHPLPQDPVALGRLLVDLTLPLDPIFAADLSGLCGPSVWSSVKNTIEPFLRKWYGCSEQTHRECALAAMFATGSADFSDVIWPLLEDPDDEVFWRACHTAKTLFLSSLGSNWLSRVKRWKERRRCSFVRALSRRGDDATISIIQHFAENDPVAKVRADAVGELRWIGARNQFFEELGKCDDSVFEILIRDNHIPEKVPSEIVERLVDYFENIQEHVPDSREQIRLTVYTPVIGPKLRINVLKKALENYSFTTNHNDYSLLSKTLEIVAAGETDWLNDWVIKHYAERRLRGEQWKAYIQSVPEGTMDELLDTFMQLDDAKIMAWHIEDLIVIGAGQRHAESLFLKMLELHPMLAGPYTKKSEPLRALYQRINQVLNKISLSLLIPIFTQEYCDTDDFAELQAILGLLSRYSSRESESARNELDEDQRKQLGSLLRGYLPTVLEQEDFYGSLKAKLAIALSCFGQSPDLPLLLQLVQADIKRRQEGLAEIKKGNCHSPRWQGASQVWDRRYVEAVRILAPEKADGILIDLLREEHYEEQAARGLYLILKQAAVKEDSSPWQPSPEPEMDFAARECGTYSVANHAKCEAYVDAIVTRINQLQRNQAEGDKIDHLNSRISCLAEILAFFGLPCTVDLILEVVAIPREFGHSHCIEALGVLLRHGFELDRKAVQRIVIPIIDALAQRDLFNDQSNQYLLKRCLCIIALTDETQEGIDLIKDIIVKTRRSFYDLEELIKAVAYKGSTGGIQWLLELAQNKELPIRIAGVLLKALGTADHPTVKEAMLNTLDPSTRSSFIMLVEHSATSELAGLIAEICKKDVASLQRVLALCKQSQTEINRSLLAEIVNLLNSSEVLSEGLMLLGDELKPRIPYPLQEAVEKRLIRHKHLTGVTYQVEPQADREIQRKLLEFTYNDPTRSETSFYLIEFCIQTRLEYGRPPVEPRHPHFKSEYAWPPLDRTHNISAQEG